MTTNLLLLTVSAIGFLMFSKARLFGSADDVKQVFFNEDMTMNFDFGRDGGKKVVAATSFGGVGVAATVATIGAPIAIAIGAGCVVAALFDCIFD